MKKYRGLILLAASTATITLLIFSARDAFDLGVLAERGVELSTVSFVLIIGLIVSKIWFHGQKADTDNLLDVIYQGRPGATGAGLAILAKILFVIWVMSMVNGKAHAADLSPGAGKYLPVLSAEIKGQWPSHPQPSTLAGLVEQESCPRCWNPRSKLKTSREEGAGMGQFTRAYNAAGNVRFDTLTDLRERYPQLSELTWHNVYDRPDLQLRGIVLLSKENYRAFANLPATESNKLAFTDASYNAGRGRIARDRRACNLTNGCDPNVWANNVERTCTASRTPIYGRRSACDITREHVYNVFAVRAPKYRM